MNIYYGVCEDRINDPLRLGRVRVRISGIHSENKIELPTSDLPWAQVMQPTNSAANSGIGHSPTGILEGTWCMLVFSDEDKQSPIIIGTLPGIPSDDGVRTAAAPQTNNVVVSSDGIIWRDSSGNPIRSGADAPVEGPVTIAKIPIEVKVPSAMVTSPAGITFLHGEEGLSSTVKGKNVVGKSTLPDDTLIHAYQDTAKVWTIGWGSTFLKDKSKVLANTVLTKRECDELFVLTLKGIYEKAARSLIKVPVTQSMFDACVSMIYNMGPDGFSHTSILPALNSGKYDAASAFIPISATKGGVLSARRDREKTLFLKNGIPNDDGTTTPVLPDAKSPTRPDATQNPVVIRSRIPSVPSTTPNDTPKQLSETGFADPKKKYPKFLNEPDTNRLARHENLGGTIVVKKEAGRATGIITATGSTWDQPAIPYNASYPYNNVYSSESGHIQEFDDTEGSERIHLYHKAGTYTEIDVNGTQVNRIIGDNFSIMERNSNILIRGNCNITVQGNANVRVENNATFDILGNFDLKVGGNIGIGAGGSIRLAAGVEISGDGPNIHLNSGKGGSVLKSKGGARGDPNLSKLITPNRQDVLQYAYDTPEDGDPTEFIQLHIREGNIDPDMLVPEVIKKAEVKIPPKVSPPIDPSSCDAIMQEHNFTMAYKLTDNWTLGQIITGSKPEIPRGINSGLSAQQIVCNLKQLTINVIDPIKRVYPNMIITNTWRSEARNKAIKGSISSDHLTGSAVDIVFNLFDEKETFDACIAIQKLLPAYNQIILEYRGPTIWIHISYKQRDNKMAHFTMRNDKTHTRGAFVLLL